MSRPAIFAVTIMAVVLAIVVGISWFSPPATQANQDSQTTGKTTPDVIYVPTAQEVVNRMLELAEVDESSMVYDLGSGDGRIPITAAQKYGARGVGIDIDPQRIKEANANAKQANVTDRVRFLQQDLFESDISEATVITLYLLPELNVRLRPKLFRELPPGTPIVSHDFDMGEWKPDHEEQVQSSTRQHTVYKWVLPAEISGVWEWTEDGNRHRLNVEQEFQYFTGATTLGGQERAITDGRIHGREVEFRISGPQPMQFRGRLEGKTLVGQIKGPAGDNNVRAQRVRTGRPAGN